MYQPIILTAGTIFAAINTRDNEDSHGSKSSMVDKFFNKQAEPEEKDSKGAKVVGEE